MAKMGRPKKEIDERVFEEAIRCPLSKGDISRIVGVSEDTLERWIKEKYDCTFTEIQDQNRAFMRKNILAAQLDLAINQKNGTMQIWLGKNYCGQVDSVTSLVEFEEKRAKAMSDEELKQATLKLVQKESKSA